MAGHVAIVVSNRDAWAGKAVEVCRQVCAVPERIPWPSARSLANPPTVLLLDVSVPEIESTLNVWARQGWQPISVVSVEPERGAAELQERLEALNYRAILPMTNQAPYWEELRQNAQRVLEGQAWLVPSAARALDCYAHEVLDAITVGVAVARETTTVEHWARRLGLTGCRRLEALFTKNSLPPCKEILQWLRLACVVEFAVRQVVRPSREELAERYAYCDGDYLGKRAKALTGLALGELLDLGVDGFFRIMGERLG